MDERVDALVELVRQQAAQLEHLRTEVATLRRTIASDDPQAPAIVSRTAAPTTAPSPVGPGSGMSRRGVMRLMGSGAAVGVAAVGAAVVTATPAAAAPGAALVIGANNDGATSPTYLTSAPGFNQAVLSVGNTDTDSGGPIGILGGAGPGAAGFSTTNEGAGVIGTSRDYVGVRGLSEKLYGVYGQSTSNPGVFGFSSAYDGVFGASDTSHGVHGFSNSEIGVYGQSTLNTALASGAAGVVGNSRDNPGVVGSSTTSYGVVGLTQSTIRGTFPESGVLGQAGAGRGVTGIATTGSGTVGQAGSGVGVQGTAAGSGLGGKFGGGRAQLYLVPSPTVTGHPTTGTHLAGELFMDKTSALYLCKTPGTPGTWKLLG